jgi:16S rRNA G966 N2-methylase RsmD
VLDFFAGSGTIGESCLALGRQFILVDNNPASLEVIAQRLSKASDIEWIGFIPSRAPIEQPELIQQANTDATPAFDAEYLMLAASITHLQDELESENAWNDSPFEWILHLPPEQKHKLGKHLAASWCKSRHLTVGQDSGEWLNINDCKVAVELSMLDANGTYTFHPIDKDDFDAILWLGISPVAAHGWVIRQTGQGTFPINPNNPPAWLAPCGGTLDQAFTVLKNLSHRK